MNAPLTPSSVELRIRDLLIKSDTVESAVKSVFLEFSDPVPSREILESISTFALAAGQQVELNRYLVQMALKNAQLPWGHFCESLFQSTIAVPANIREALRVGAGEQRLVGELARSRFLDGFDETIRDRHLKRKHLIEEKISKIRDELLNVAAVFRAQGLLKDEAKILQRLIKFFPKDENLFEMQEQQKVQEKRQAPVETSHRETVGPSSFLDLPTGEEIKILDFIHEQMQEILQAESNPEVALQTREDFSIAHIFWGNYRAASQIAPQKPVKNKKKERQLFWLRFEIWLLDRNFGEILLQAEQQLSLGKLSPDDVLALNYYRAKAFWGLHQDTLAIELIETLMSSHPNYRDLASLLVEWKAKVR